MKPLAIFLLPLTLLCALGDDPAPRGDWSLRGEVVHAGTGGDRYFVALRLTDGQVGGVPLDGARIVLAGDRGKRVVVMDPSVTEQQRPAVESAVRAIFPIDWSTAAFETRRIDWEVRDAGTLVIRVAGRGEVRFEPNRDRDRNPVKTRIWWGVGGRGCEGFTGTATFTYAGDGLEVKDVQDRALKAWVEVEHWAAEER